MWTDFASECARNGISIDYHQCVKKDWSPLWVKQRLVYRTHACRSKKYWNLSNGNCSCVSVKSFWGIPKNYAKEGKLLMWLHFQVPSKGAWDPLEVWWYHFSPLSMQPREELRIQIDSNGFKHALSATDVESQNKSQNFISIHLTDMIWKWLFSLTTFDFIFKLFFYRWNYLYEGWNLILFNFYYV